MLNILIGCTGSVATIKLSALVSSLQSKIQSDIQIRVVLTERAKHFLDGQTIPENVDQYSDEDEWAAWSKRGDPVLHIELAKWADVFLIAPLDANTLAKIANGICDNLMTCVARAWDVGKPLVFCPAMNTKMFEHPLTKKQIEQLEGWGYRQIPVVTKTLICGDTGAGAMAEVDTIVDFVFDYFSRHFDSPKYTSKT